MGWPIGHAASASGGENYAARGRAEGARGRGRPAVPGCFGSGVSASPLLCSRDLAPIVSRRAPTTTAADRTAMAAATRTAAMPAITSVGEPDGETASATNATVVSMTSRASGGRMIRSYRTGGRAAMSGVASIRL